MRGLTELSVDPDPRETRPHEAPAQTIAVTEAASETSTPATDPSAEGDVGTNHNEADTGFAQMMIVHHAGAIEMADLAVERADSEDVRTLAEGISAAQGPEIEEMTSWLETWGEETSPMGGMEGMGHAGMDRGGMDQEGAMAELESLSGSEFDRRLLELMIMHHEGAVEMAQTELDNGESSQALGLAQKIIEDQEPEIEQMEQMVVDL
ncbi:DUF305 domain-containing protein [Georgenia sp. MJ206]|uniref:DUF305 domain-containing protein n=1 Tax=Georgenia wangjunii TaxID=3117730 RepID=UPI002F2608D1